MTAPEITTTEDAGTPPAAPPEIAPTAQSFAAAADAVAAEEIRTPGPGRSRRRDRRTGNPPGRPRKDGQPAGQGSTRPPAPGAAAAAPPVDMPTVKEVTGICRFTLDYVARATNTTPPEPDDPRRLAEALMPIIERYGASIAPAGPFVPLLIFGVTYGVPRAGEAIQARRAARESERLDAERAAVVESHSRSAGTVKADRHQLAAAEGGGRVAADPVEFPSGRVA